MKNKIYFFIFLILIQNNVKSDSFTINFSNYDYLDSSETTAYWNIGLEIAQAYGIQGDDSGDIFDLGNGTDGICLFTGSLVSTTYDCVSVTFQGNVSFSGSEPLIIKSMGNVNVNGMINISGFDGMSGLLNYSSIAGGAGGPAGGKGGDWLELDSNPSVHNANNGSDGESIGTEGGGKGGSKSGAVSGGTGGGGGGGASYGVTQLGGPSQEGGDDDGFSDTGGAAGADGTSYGGQEFFKTALMGGSGGGAGGSGDDSTGDVYSGGSGGGGGGAMRIVAGGNITIINGGGINADGGNGGNGATFSGGGGGGSGGAIFLQSQQDIILEGTAFISAVGGTGGKGGGSKGGNGGNGGDGRILLEDQDGIVSSNVNPVSQFPSSKDRILNSDYSNDIIYVQTLAYDTGYDKVNYQNVESEESLNGGTIKYNLSESIDGSQWSSWSDRLNIKDLSERYVRLRAEISPSSPEKSPMIDSITIHYERQGQTENVKNYNSKFQCGLMNRDMDRNIKFWETFLTFILGMLCIFPIYRILKIIK